MNVKKKIIHIIGCVTVGIILSSCIWGGIYIRQVNLSDRNLAAAQAELRSTNSRLNATTDEVRQCRTVISECNDSVGRITEQLDNNNKSLQSVIDNLRVIAVEVQYLEGRLSDFYSGGCNTDNSIDSTETGK